MSGRNVALGIAALLAAMLATAPALADEASEALECSRAAPQFQAAARKNAELLRTLAWSPMGTPERGWEPYAPLTQQELRTRCDATTPAFAQALAALQTEHKLEADGVFGPSTFQVLKGLWQERRPFVMARLRGECPTAPASFVMTNLPKDEDTFGREDRRLRGDALRAYRHMVEAARRDGVLLGDPKALTIFSGYRQPDVDHERCSAEGNCDGKRRAACSAHATGFAVDLNVGHAPGYRIDSTDPVNRLHQTRSDAYRWLVRNAGRFGFVNYVFEPWHWEWVGEPARAALEKE